MTDRGLIRDPLGDTYESGRVVVATRVRETAVEVDGARTSWRVRAGRGEDEDVDALLAIEGVGEPNPSQMDAYSCGSAACFGYETHSSH